jgi:hypothetical protein
MTDQEKDSAERRLGYRRRGRGRRVVGDRRWETRDLRRPSDRRISERRSGLRRREIPDRRARAKA